MGKASSFVALSRAAGVPARVAFQTLESPEKEFLSPEVRALWGGKRGRPLPWHSLGEAFLNGRWVKLDATIDAPTAARLGKPYTQEFDGITDIHTVEGPILRENGSYADYPPEVAQWYEVVATAVLNALDSRRIVKKLPKMMTSGRVRRSMRCDVTQYVRPLFLCPDCSYPLSENISLHTHKGPQGGLHVSVADSFD